MHYYSALLDKDSSNLGHPAFIILNQSNESTKNIVHEKHKRHEQDMLLFVFFVPFVDCIFCLWTGFVIPSVTFRG